MTVKLTVCVGESVRLALGLKVRVEDKVTVIEGVTVRLDVGVRL